MPDNVILVRHTEVARQWRGRCYGVSDVGLSRTGAAELLPLAVALAAERPNWVVHSDRIRARRLAEAVAKAAACPLLPDHRWQERDFGSWEGLSWNAIYRATGNAMDGMIEAPDTYRPGGGETTFEMASRALEAFSALPKGSGIVVTHGGPIAALVGQQKRLTPRQWLAMVPATGAFVTVARIYGAEAD
jgi:broad specificity phosphatase PhoE